MSELATKETATTQEKKKTNTAGLIPSAPFIHDVGAYLQEQRMSADDCIKGMDENYRLYKLTEQHILRGRQGLLEKIPEIKKNLDTVKYLQSVQEGDPEANPELKYQLADHVYGHAKLTKLGTVCLWLGAKTMVEYTYDEALEMLQDSLARTETALAHHEEDLAFVKDQIVTLEVNVARVFNWDVKKRRADKEKELLSK